MDRPTLVLLPGLHGTDDLFGPFVAIIPPAFRVRIISYPPRRALSYDELLKLIEQELREETGVMLIAESFAGPLAIRFAAANSDRVRGLVLVATFIRSPAPRFLRWMMVPLLFRLPPIWLGTRLLLFFRSFSQPLPRELRAALRKVPPHVLAYRIREVLALDGVSELKRCTVPILYLRAAHDAIVGPKCSEAILAQRSDVMLRTLPGPHMLLQTNPRGAWEEVERFIAGILRRM